jgi:hypothetical protein
MNRIRQHKKDLIAMRDPDDKMLALMEILGESELIPERPGAYYTYLYRPKTPNITYDEYPLVIITSIEQWGWKGFNFHWRRSRNYTFPEVSGKMMRVDEEELLDLLDINYAKFDRT